MTSGSSNEASLLRCVCQLNVGVGVLQRGGAPFEYFSFADGTLGVCLLLRCHKKDGEQSGAMVVDEPT